MNSWFSLFASATSNRIRTETNFYFSSFLPGNCAVHSMNLVTTRDSDECVRNRKFVTIKLWSFSWNFRFWSQYHLPSKNYNRYILTLCTCNFSHSIELIFLSFVANIFGRFLLIKFLYSLFHSFTHLFCRTKVWFQVRFFIRQFFFLIAQPLNILLLFLFRTPESSCQMP